MKNIENIELVKLAKNGDTLAFEELVKQNYLLVYKIAFKWCGIKEDAEDITQEIFIKLARNIESFKEESTFQTWLYRISINTAKDFNKRNDKRRKQEVTHYKQEDIASRQNQHESPIVEKLHELIGELPSKLKETAILVFGEGMNHKEAAIVLNCAEKTISWRVFEVKKRLRKYFDHEEVII